MYEVKHSEAQGLLTDLKSFAFQQSPGFRNGQQNGVEVMKNFYHRDPLPHSLAEKVGIEMCKSTFTFTAFRVTPVRQKPAYSYGLSASVERTIPRFPVHLLQYIAKKTLKKHKGFEEISEGALCEASEMTLETSDHELRDITVANSYSLSYAGRTIFTRSTDEILYGHPCDEIAIPDIESDGLLAALYAPRHVTQEKLDFADSIVNDMEFFQTIEPLSTEIGVDNYRSAAAVARTILHVLQTGDVL